MFDIFIMDLGGHESNVQALQQQFPHARVVRYYSDHLSTLKRCVARARTPFIWVISSCCDYSEFDFEYRAAPWEEYQIHCWASGQQQFGDTFLIPVREFRKQQSVKLLEWYQHINYHNNGVPRLSWPVLTAPDENLTQIIKNHKFTSPYIFINQTVEFDPPLWKDRNFYTFTQSGAVSLVPRDISGSLRNQIYDYKHLTKSKDLYISEKPLDIIYISNGEPAADQWYQHLVNTVQTENNITRISGITGRVAAYQAAARASSTPWFFAVFAKLEVDTEFDWCWQPDWLQQPKHYIFHSRNPVNGLEYGHMGVIAYNKKLVLENNDPGLDFTLSQSHAVVPVVSATAHYNTTPELTWRTAFREAIKLKADAEKTGSIESKYRLERWLTCAEGKHSKWSLRGARDAVEYYAQTAGEHTELMKSFEWGWLHERYTNRYSQ